MMKRFHYEVRSGTLRVAQNGDWYIIPDDRLTFTIHDRTKGFDHIVAVAPDRETAERIVNALNGDGDPSGGGREP